jgi:hypothetical protein
MLCAKILPRTDALTAVDAIVSYFPPACVAAATAAPVGDKEFEIEKVAASRATAAPGLPVGLPTLLLVLPLLEAVRVTDATHGGSTSRIPLDTPVGTVQALAAPPASLAAAALL